MEKDERYLVELRDCFAGGYTLPQFCIDEKISKPLFVSEEKFLKFVWEAYVQFRYDKRMLAQFSFLNVASGKINISTNCVLGDMEYKNISEVNLAEVRRDYFPHVEEIFFGRQSNLSRRAHRLFYPQNLLRNSFASFFAKES